jgi:hypothetical protein
MKKLLRLICCISLLVGCTEEKDVDPAGTSTFVRYFGSEHNHTAVLAMEAHDGYTLLSNIIIEVDGLGDFEYKVRMIHTSTNGNTLWTQEYPEFSFSNEFGDDVDGFSASSFIVLDDGYLVIGDRIYKDGSTKLQLMKAGVNGEVQEADIALISSQPISVDQPTSLHGRAVTLAADGDFLILGNIDFGINNTDHPVKDMFVAKVDAQTLTTEWTREYGSGEGTVANRLYVGENSNILWGGSVHFSSSFDVRLIDAPSNSQTAKLDNPVGDPTRNEIINDFCETSGGFAFVGSTAESTSDDDDIFFTKISNTSFRELGESDSFDFNERNDRAVSITPGVDGGYLILATVQSGSTRGYGLEDYYLLKVDISGTTVWDINYGGPDKEEAASVRTTSDNSYLVFGTTYFGEMKKLMLMKVRADGSM